MLPIVNAEVKGQKLSIYNAAVQPKHPLYGLRFTNLTDLYLMQGPITVFDAASMRRCQDRGPPARQRTSDQLRAGPRHRGGPAEQGRPDELLSVRLLKGTLTATRKYARRPNTR